jgi:hypothetical protein
MCIRDRVSDIVNLVAITANQAAGTV